MKKKIKKLSLLSIVAFSTILTSCGFETDFDKASSNPIENNSTVVDDDKPGDNTPDDPNVIPVPDDTKNKVTVSFVSGNSLIKSEQVKVNTRYVYNGEEPTVDSSQKEAGYDYVFKGWQIPGYTKVYRSNNLPVISKNTTFRAVFEKTGKTIDVTFYNGDGTILYTQKVKYGDKITYDETKGKPSKNTKANSALASSDDFKGQWTNNRDASIFTEDTVAYATVNIRFNPIFGSEKKVYRVIFKDEDGSILSSKYYEEGSNPTYAGEPFKPEDKEYTYKFAYWKDEAGNKVDLASRVVNNDLTYTAVFTKTIKKFSVTVRRADGTIIQNKITVDAGSTKTFNYNNASDLDYTASGQNYKFVGWKDNKDPRTTKIYEDTEFVAMYQQEEIKYSVTYKNGDGSVLKVVNDLKYNAPLQLISNIPTKTEEGYDNTFAYWVVENTGVRASEITNVTSNLVLEPVFKRTAKKYVIEYLNGDGSVMLRKSADYGSELQYENNIVPTKASQGGVKYTFANQWISKVDGSIFTSDNSLLITSNIQLEPVFNDAKQVYKVSYFNDDGALVTSKNFEHGSNPVLSKNMLKNQTEQYSYEFVGWTKEKGSDKVVDLSKEIVTGEASYYACYKKTLRSYNVRFLDADGKVLSTEKVQYGSHPTYDYESANLSHKTEMWEYTFIGFENNLDPKTYEVKGNIDFVCKYKEEYVKYSIVYENEDGSVFYTDPTEYRYNDSYKLITDKPKKIAHGFAYKFENWVLKDGDSSESSDTNIKGNLVFVPVFSSTREKFNVYIKDYRNYNINTHEIEYEGKLTSHMVTNDKALVTKTYSDAVYDYTFTGRFINSIDGSIIQAEDLVDYVVTDNVSFTAEYSKEYRVFKVSIDFGYDDLGHGRVTWRTIEKQYKYGTPIKTIIEDIEKSDDRQEYSREDGYYIYNFRTWSAYSGNIESDYRLYTIYSREEKTYSVTVIDDLTGQIIDVKTNYKFGDEVQFSNKVSDIANPNKIVKKSVLVSTDPDGTKHYVNKDYAFSHWEYEYETGAWDDPFLFGNKVVADVVMRAKFVEVVTGAQLYFYNDAELKDLATRGYNKFGEKIQLPPTKPTRKHALAYMEYVFEYWQVLVDGQLVKFDESMLNTSKDDCKYTTFVAKYREEKKSLSVDIYDSKPFSFASSLLLSGYKKFKYGDVINLDEYNNRVTKVYQTERSTFEFTGKWTYVGSDGVTYTTDKNTITVTDDLTIKPVMKETVRKYTVKFLSWDNKELQVSEYEYGQTPKYTGAKPTMPDAFFYKYRFVGWRMLGQSEIGMHEVTNDETWYVPVFDKVYDKRTITFVAYARDIDGGLYRTNHIFKVEVNACDTIPAEYLLGPGANPLGYWEENPYTLTNEYYGFSKWISNSWYDVPTSDMVIYNDVEFAFIAERFDD